VNGRPGRRVEVRLTNLARPPSPEELEAMVLAVDKALAAAAPAEAVIAPSDWRFSGRWWRQHPGRSPGCIEWFAKSLE
jgi:hypothetical protein